MFSANKLGVTALPITVAPNQVHEKNPTSV